MAYPRIRQNFSAPRIVDPTRGAMEALSNVSQMVRNAEAADFAEKKRQDALAKEMAEAQWRKERAGVQDKQWKAGQALRQAAEDRAVAADYAAGFTTNTTPIKVLTEKGKTTVLPGKEGEVSPEGYKISNEIGAIADDVNKINAVLERPSKGEAKVLKYTPFQWDPRGLPEQAGQYVNEKGKVLSKDELGTRKQQQLDRIEALTGAVMADYKQGEVLPTTVTTKDEFTYKAPKKQDILSNLLTQAEKDKGEPLTIAEKGALGRRATELYNRAEDMVYKNKMLDLQYSGPKESTYQKEMAKYRAKKDAGVLNRDKKETNTKQYDAMMDTISKKGLDFWGSGDTAEAVETLKTLKQYDIPAAIANDAVRQVLLKADSTFGGDATFTLDDLDRLNPVDILDPREGKYITLGEAIKQAKSRGARVVADPTAKSGYSIHYPSK